MRNTGDLIADIYGLGTGPWTMTPVTRGALGQIWKLSGNGSDWAVKELIFAREEPVVEGEATLRDTAAGLGVRAPRLMPDRTGSHVSRLPADLGGSYLKLYDWVDGTPADPADPALLDWCGRTLALLHRAGEGTTQTPVDWYEKCYPEDDWADLHDRVRRAAPPWAEALSRCVAGPLPELTRFVSPSDPADLVVSHRDVQPQNVLLTGAGPVLLDWDNAGPVAARRELAHAVFVWSGGNAFRPEAARRLVRAYRDAAGPAVLDDLNAFSMLFATALNYVHVQAECAIDPHATPAQRQFAADQTTATLRTLPSPSAVSRLLTVLKPQW
ncbi:phosphotransferase enzyme family protein [Streptomyces griseoruber]|uniref:Phosphotransferase n=1 Tax=Streptomyces griseoruber TaxID=1943 RepID=A0A101TBU6_9ACTN|nr:aminoglycoside phosphotransferase family protein [Streptomyces griseoruber]KUN89290.1 phosphotransferase [Streptomyces griseoruber]